MTRRIPNLQQFKPGHSQSMLNISWESDKLNRFESIVLQGDTNLSKKYETQIAITFRETVQFWRFKTQIKGKNEVF